MRLHRRSGFLGALVVACSWAHAQGNPAERPARDLTPLVGTWNGAHLEQRSSCTTDTSNGFHGTYSQYLVGVSTAGGFMGISEDTLSGLHCVYNGPYRVQSGAWSWSGTVQCSDNRAGDFQTESIFALTKVMRIRMTIRLTGTETCVIDAVLSGTRF